MSLRTVMQKSAAISRRFSSLTSMPKRHGVPDIYNKADFKKTWLSDPSTYPIIVIMATALSFAVGMSYNGIQYKNVKISPSLKHDYVSKDESGPRGKVTEVVARNPGGFYPEAMKSTRYEGLGVDHEEWVKSKQATN